MTHGYATQARCFHVKYTHRYILYTHTTMRYRCEILNHGIDGYEVWLHGRNQGRSGAKPKKGPLLSDFTLKKGPLLRNSSLNQ